jgi:hypothetical protein
LLKEGVDDAVFALGHRLGFDASIAELFPQFVNFLGLVVVFERAVAVVPGDGDVGCGPWIVAGIDTASPFRARREDETS